MAKSNQSGSNACVEGAFVEGGVAVRDSKAAAAILLLLLGITLQALSWVVRLATRIGSGSDDRRKAGPLGY